VSQAIPLEGTCHPAFAGVRDALERNMAHGEEVGCAVCITLEGETVVDLWAGYRDAARIQPWQRGTITGLRSVVKSMAALCALRLVQNGVLELDAPVAKYWPEFAQNGKAAITVRMLLAHQASLPYADAAPRGSMHTPGVVEAALAAQAPEWPPGSMPCYHSFTYPVLVAALVRHASGRSVHEVLSNEVATPLDAEYWIGLEEHQLPLCAEYIETPGTPSLEGMKRNQASPLFRAWTPMPLEENYNTRGWLMSPYTGHGNPRGAARIYAALANGGVLNGYTVLEPELLAEATRAHWDGVEFMTQRHFRMGLGFLLSCPPFRMGGQPRNFGHPGTGGALVFADPQQRMSFSYCPNRMSPYADTGPYASPLIAAAYKSLGVNLE